MDLLFLAPAIIIIAKVLYVGTAILQCGEDPKFEGDKLTCRS